MVFLLALALAHPADAGAPLSAAQAAIAERAEVARLESEVAELDRKDGAELEAAHAATVLALAAKGRAVMAYGIAARAAERALRRASPSWASATDKGHPLSETAVVVERSGAEAL